MQDQDYIDQAFQQGATDYVTKPFDPSELNERLNTVVTQFAGDAAAQPESTADQPDLSENLSDVPDTDTKTVAATDKSATPNAGAGTVATPHADAGTATTPNADAGTATTPNADADPVATPDDDADTYIASDTDTEITHEYGLDYPFNLQNFGRILAHLTFENYLETLSSVGKKEIHIFTVGIRNIQEIYDTTSDYSFEFVLRQTATALATLLEPHRVMFSYFGRGVFCVTIRNKYAKMAEYLPQQFEEYAANLDETSDYLAEHKVKIIVGPLSDPSMFRGPLPRAKKAIADMQKHIASEKPAEPA